MSTFFDIEESIWRILQPFLHVIYFKDLWSRPCTLSQCLSERLVLICFPSAWLRVALETLDRLTESLDFTDYASRIIHPIVRTLDSTPELRSTSMDTLSSLVFQLGKKVANTVPRAPFKCSYYPEDYFQPPYCWLHMNSIFGNPLSLYYFLPDC